MTRLVHSQGGFIRSLQMSSARFFAFVEGRLDRVFFDKVLASAFQGAPPKHQVYAIKELPGDTGGKPTLLNWFRQFRKNGLLRTSAFGKPMVCVFIADKDCDDYSRKQLRSPHLLYTQTYDLEAHLYACADLQRAIAESCGVTVAQAQTLLPDPRAWLARNASLWKEWIALCLISHSRGINCGCTFDRVSQVNPDPFQPANANQIATFKESVRSKLGLTVPAFDRHFAAAIKRVETSIARGEPLKYFKGKWLTHLIQKHLEAKPKPADANFSGVGDRLLSTLVSQVALVSGCACSAAYQVKLSALGSGL